MAIDIYMQERCGRCADVQYEIKDLDFEYELHFIPPKNHDIKALEYPITEPVLVDEERAPEGIVGHEEILSWVKSTFGK